MKIFSIFANLFFRPRKAFQLLLDYPKSFWWLVLVLAMVVFAGKAALQSNLQMTGEMVADSNTVPSTEESGAVGGETGELLPNSGEMTQTPVDGMSSNGNSLLFGAISIIIPVVITLLATLIWSTFLHITAIMAGGSNTFRQMLAMVSLVWLPSIVKSILQIGVMFVSGKPVTAEGLEHLVGASQMASDGLTNIGGALSLGEQIMQEFLKNINVFTLWFLFLLVVGTAVTGKIKSRTALWVVVLCWAVIMLMKLIPILVVSSIGF
ncbi:MAG TPA: YIP1 family protein [Anaerolineales bacterium]|nr:YIP1 family protein [Anaerolineales bacterium]